MRVYEAQVYFGAPERFHGERRTVHYLVRATSVAKAANVALRIARRDKAPENTGLMVQKVSEVGELDN